VTAVGRFSSPFSLQEQAGNRTITILRLREVRGKLVWKPSGQPHEIVVNGRDDWIGWFELVEDQVNAVALVSTARIGTLLAADMFCVIEADNRLPLTRFSATVIKQVGGTPYDHVMLVDGNDDRDRPRGNIRLAVAKSGRSASLSAGRPTCRRNTASSCRSTTISSSLNVVDRNNRPKNCRTR